MLGRVYNVDWQKKSSATAGVLGSIYYKRLMENRKKKFGKKVRTLRLGLDLGDGKVVTVRKLGEVSGVDFALISCVERGERNAGEVSLRKLAKAFQLNQEASEAFVEEGLSAAGSKQVLDRFRDFPTHFLHLLPREILAQFPDLDPKEIEVVEGFQDASQDRHPDLVWRVGSKWFVGQITIATGTTPSQAMDSLGQKLKGKRIG